jgi:hypothetical protein
MLLFPPHSLLTVISMSKEALYRQHPGNSITNSSHSLKRIKDDPIGIHYTMQITEALLVEIKYTKTF